MSISRRHFLLAAPGLLGVVRRAVIGASMNILGVALAALPRSGTAA